MTCGPPVVSGQGLSYFLWWVLSRSLNKAMGYPILGNVLGGLCMSTETERILCKGAVALCCLELTTVCLTTCSSTGQHLGVSASWHYGQLLCELSPCRCLAISLRNIPQDKISRSQNMSIFLSQNAKVAPYGTPIYAVASWAWGCHLPTPNNGC